MADERTPFDDEPEATPFDDNPFGAPAEAPPPPRPQKAPEPEPAPQRPPKPLEAPQQQWQQMPTNPVDYAPPVPQKPAAAAEFAPPVPAKPVQLDFYAAAPPPPPVYASAPPQPQPPAYDPEFERRRRELDRREQELQRREQALAQRELGGGAQAVAVDPATGAAKAPRAPNWPPRPFPKQLVYQNMDEIQMGAPRRLARMMYYHWMVTVVLMVYNVVCAIALTATQVAIGNLILACIEGAGWIPLSFFIYRSFYNAARTLKSMRFFFFFCFFVVQIAVHGFGALGWKGSGFSGIWWAATAENQGAAIMCAVCGILFGISTALCVYMWIHIKVLFRAAGGLRAAARASQEAALEQAAKRPDLVVAAGTVAMQQSV